MNRFPDRLLPYSPMFLTSISESTSIAILIVTVHLCISDFSVANITNFPLSNGSSFNLFSVSLEYLIF